MRIRLLDNCYATYAGEIQRFTIREYEIEVHGLERLAKTATE